MVTLDVTRDAFGAYKPDRDDGDLGKKPSEAVVLRENTDPRRRTWTWSGARREGGGDSPYAGSCYGLADSCYGLF